MRIIGLTNVLLVLPALVLAQLPAREQNPAERLRQQLPADVAEDVATTVNDAIARGLPGLAIAERALEGVAKGRTGEQISTAARELASQLAAGRDALRQAGRSPDASEIEAAATAMSMGVDGQQVSALASSAPSGRSLAVPLAVIGALVERGLPSDGALAAVKAGLERRASDPALMDMPAEAGRMIGEGLRPSEVGLALAAQRAGMVVPPPVPAGVPTNPGQQAPRPKTPVGTTPRP